MRHLTNKIFTILLLILFMLPTNGTIKGSLEYTIPVDYSKINETEFSAKADKIYKKIPQKTHTKLNDDITSALNLYAILSNKNPQNINYTIRLGNLYRIIDKDRQAKGCYYRAMGISPSDPEPYYRLGEFFYSKQQYRRALKYYKESYKKGYSNNPAVLMRISDINKKLWIKTN